MSATGRGAQRRADDFYETPAWCTDAIVRALGLSQVDVALEPACGNGAIISAVGESIGHRIDWYACEIDGDRARSCERRTGVFVFVTDFLSSPKSRHADLIITNPPYSLAEEFIRKCLREWPESDVVMLLRLNFLGSQKRAEFLREHTPDVYVLPRRPSFTGKGTDATEYAWFHWPAGGHSRSRGSIEVLEVP